MKLHHMENNTEFKIEDIPVASKRGRKPGESKYPIALLEIGQSFFVPNGNGRSLQSLVWRTGKRLGRKFAVETVAEGIRVGRTA